MILELATYNYIDYIVHTFKADLKSAVIQPLLPLIVEDYTQLQLPFLSPCMGATENANICTLRAKTYLQTSLSLINYSERYLYVSVELCFDVSSLSHCSL